MVFSSFVYLLAFFPIVLVLYYVLPKKVRNLLLLIFSLLFYAWGEPIYVLIMVLSTVIDYTNGLCIEHYKKKEKPGWAKFILVLDVCFNLGILGFFKYTDFVLESINSITGAGISLLHIALPIGISFYTFQTMSYTIDVYRGVVPAQKNILTFATYVTLFPQLIAGPIVQYKTVEAELEDRKVDVNTFCTGVFRFTIGLAKKVILANQIGALFDTIQGLNQLSVATAWLGAISYAFQIYFDFSGYSDMAIGLGKMFGFHFLENFNYPYISQSISEFWRRWHISLGAWFREYVYIPLGGNRRGLGRQLFNIFVVWMLTGLWHGAEWNFVLWGVYFGIFLLLEKFILLKWLDKIPRVFRHIYTLFVVLVSWVIFAITDFGQMVAYVKTMFGGGAPLWDGNFLYYIRTNGVLLILLVICSLDYKTWMKNHPKVRAVVNGRGAEVARIAIMLVLFVVSFSFLVGDSYNPFLYFRF